MIHYGIKSLDEQILVLKIITEIISLLIDINTRHLICVLFWDFREIGNKDNLRVII